MRVLDKKLKKATSLRTDTPEMLEALSALSSFYIGDQNPSGNTLEARRNLRGELEQRGLTLAKSFLAKIGDVKTKLDSASGKLAEVHSTCDVLLESIDSTANATSGFVSAIKASREQRIAATDRVAFVEHFLKRFKLGVEYSPRTRKDS